MKTKATNLTPEQIELAWNTAEKIDGQDSLSIRKDFLGAIIHREDYNVMSKYGWCIEYVLSPQLLDHYRCSTQDAFCEENIRVLFIGNYDANINECTGHYAARYQADDEQQNRRQFVWHPSDIKLGEGIPALKQKFHLSDDILREIFPQYNK